jgi:hypothetical protein
MEDKLYNMIKDNKEFSSRRKTFTILEINKPFKYPRGNLNVIHNGDCLDFMKTYLIKTKAFMEQSYNIEAESKEKAEEIALENTQDVIDQTVIGDVEILSTEEVEE